MDVGSGLLIIKTLDVVRGATACELARLTQDVQCRVDWEKQMRYCPDKSLELLEATSEQVRHVPVYKRTAQSNSPLFCNLLHS